MEMNFKLVPTSGEFISEHFWAVFEFQGDVGHPMKCECLQGHSFILLLHRLEMTMWCFLVDVRHTIDRFS